MRFLAKKIIQKAIQEICKKHKLLKEQVMGFIIKETQTTLFISKE